MTADCCILPSLQAHEVRSMPHKAVKRLTYHKSQVAERAGNRDVTPIKYSLMVIGHCRGTSFIFPREGLDGPSFRRDRGGSAAAIDLFRVRGRTRHQG